MNSLLNETEDDDILDQHGRKDREITLGTTVVLGIFFALAVLCAVFFGFGYSMGSKRNLPGNLPTASEPTANATFGAFKPAPGSPAVGGSVKQTQPAPEPSPTPHAQSVTVESNQSPPPPTVREPLPIPAPRVGAESTPAAHLAARPSAPSVVVSAPIVAVPGQPLVQIAAVSHQEDADLMVSTLKRKGYDVAVRHEPQDKLFHIQIGPFPNRKDADAMRVRLLADGFIGYIK